MPFLSQNKTGHTGWRTTGGHKGRLLHWTVCLHVCVCVLRRVLGYVYAVCVCTFACKIVFTDAARSYESRI